MVERQRYAEYVYRPDKSQQPTAALLYIHGGGFMYGSASMFHATCAHFVHELGVVVVNVGYRLAPDVPFPGPLEDCYAALLWMKQQADTLGIDPQRIAIVGESAGAGLTAALAQLAHDRGEIAPAFQLLMHPMLDDRTALKCDHEGRGEFLWAPGSNRLGWTAYLGHPPTIDAAPDYAAPARRRDLAGLAQAWIGVGTLDLLYPESKEYAHRLNEAGVPCELYEVQGRTTVLRVYTRMRLSRRRSENRAWKRCGAAFGWRNENGCLRDLAGDLRGFVLLTISNVSYG